MLVNGLIMLGSFAAMEAFSWAIHKYLLHGVLWRLHKTHHQPGKGFFELNDLVSLFFASLAIGLIISGIGDWRLWVGLGISAYGLVYFMLHDVFIHRRLHIFRGGLGRHYLARIARAHRLHHRYVGQKPSRFFGLLWVRSLGTEKSA